MVCFLFSSFLVTYFQVLNLLTDNNILYRRTTTTMEKKTAQENISSSWAIVCFFYNHCRYEFSTVSLNSFFVMFYYSYEMCVRILGRLRPVVPKLWKFQQEMGCIISAGTNFQPFLLILFSLCFIIATKCVYKFSEGCAQSFRSYGSFSMKWVA